MKGEEGCVCAWVRAQCNPRHAVQGVKQGRQALLCSARGGKNPWQQEPAAGALGDIAKMAMTAGTTHCSLGEMLKVICYKHPLCPRALERITPARPDTDKQLQVVILGPKLLASLGACVFCALHPSW